MIIFKKVMRQAQAQHNEGCIAHTQGVGLKAATRYFFSFIQSL